jgi:Family of unknown function (DUF5681)
MPFQPGTSGNPGGKMTERIASNTLRVAVLEVVGGKGKHRNKQRLRRICERIAEAAVKGEAWAIGMVFDRIDGKPLQAIDTTLTHEAGTVFVELLRALNDARHGRTIEHIPPQIEPAE